MELSTNIIVKNTLDNIDIPKDERVKEWFENFKELSKFEQAAIITELNKSQAIYIKDSMGKMQNPIHLYNLGKFYYKESRVDFYKIKEDNPDMLLDEIIQIVKDNYMDRVEKVRKRRKSRDIKLRL